MADTSKRPAAPSGGCRQIPHIKPTFEASALIVMPTVKYFTWYLVFPSVHRERIANTPNLGTFRHWPKSNMEVGYTRHRLAQWWGSGPWGEQYKSITDPGDESGLVWHVQHRWGSQAAGRTSEVAVKGAWGKANHCIALGHFTFQKVVVFVLY